MISNTENNLGTNGNKTAEHTAECAPTPPTAGLTVRAGSGPAYSGAVASPSSALLFNRPALQPVLDVRAYLETRKPQKFTAGEEALFITLPVEQQHNIRALLAAFRLVSRVALASSISEGCRCALTVLGRGRWSPARFRTQYDLWAKAGDWTVLVNRCKTDIASGWRDRNAGLPEEFLRFVEQKFAEFKRADGKRQALFAIKRQWRTGRDAMGRSEPIPGYGYWQQWAKKNFPHQKFEAAPIPAGWGYSNIITQIKARGKFTTAIRALTHDSEAAARAHLPQILGTRKGLRFLEKITFDDVRTDWLVFNPATGEAEELWLLVARDEATALVLGFVMHPATVREDGKATHLGAQQMKQLAGYLLEHYPLPPYAEHWIVERGTATLAEGVKAALGELLGLRIIVHYTSMIGDKSPLGYAEKRKGNSRGKASHESHNRLFHTQGSYVPAQTGNRWDIRPAELNARTDEAREIWEMASRLPAHLRGQEKYPLLTLAQAREHLFRICGEQNFRTEHQLEDFAELLEWFNPATGAWSPQHTIPHPLPAGASLRKRKEMPVERAYRLAAAVSGWTHVSPDVIRAFYEHTERVVTVEANGEIKFRHEGRDLVFAHAGIALKPDTKCLGYLHPDDAKFLYLTNGKGAFLGTWTQRGRVGFRDQEALAEAMRYTHAAREAAKATARELAAPQIADLEAMRAHNAELAGDFIEVTEAPKQITGEIQSPVSDALKAVSGLRKESQAAAQRKAEAAAADILASKEPAAIESAEAAANDLLAAIGGGRS